ncbi:MAG: MurT ligase domain-containing protein [Coriobacteriia bacterium]|nr:MurT ligase domain-containing protein [Coriobacteriia bacterium]
MKVLAIIVAKLLAAIGGLSNRGSVTPGAIALRICPSLAERLVLPKIKVVVTGSSGKGSTSGYIAESLRQLGFTVVHNAEGSNMRNGIVTSLLKAASLTGRIKADALVAEIDERSCKHTLPFIKPDLVVITNVTRDQPPRQRHTDFIYSEIRQSLRPDQQLILNGDDPLLMRFGLPDELLSIPAFIDATTGAVADAFATASNITSYGITADWALKSRQQRFDAVDAAYCPVCASLLVYDYYLFESQGSFKCPNGHMTHRLDTAVTQVISGQARDGSEDQLIIDDSITIKANSRLLFNVTNIMAAYTTLTKLLPETDRQRIADTLSQQAISQKIYSSYDYRQRHVYVLNNKAENAATFNQSIVFASRLNEPIVLLVGWKEISRRYDSDDLAWLYDVNFDLLAGRVSAAICTGVDAETIAVRLKYAGIPEANISCFDQMDSRVTDQLEHTAGTIVAALNFDHVQPFIDLTAS